MIKVNDIVSYEGGRYTVTLDRYPFLHIKNLEDDDDTVSVDAGSVKVLKLGTVYVMDTSRPYQTSVLKRGINGNGQVTVMIVATYTSQAKAYMVTTVLQTMQEGEIS